MKKPDLIASSIYYGAHGALFVLLFFAYRSTLFGGIGGLLAIACLTVGISAFYFFGQKHLGFSNTGWAFRAMVMAMMLAIGFGAGCWHYAETRDEQIARRMHQPYN